MVIRRPSRLYRRLEPEQPLFRFTTEQGTYLDDGAITGITIRRGSGSPGGGVTPSTLEVGLTGYAAIQSGSHCELNLTTSGAQLLNERTSAAASVIQPRFRGRIGRQTVDDRGRRQMTTMLASSWTSQLGHVAKAYSPSIDTPVSTVLAELLTSRALPRLTGPTRLAPVNHYGTVHTEEDAQTWSDINRWTSTLGIKVIETRAGSQQLTSHTQRWDDAVSRMGNSIPVIRSQVLAPATWEQTTETIPRNQRLTWGSGNGTNSRTWGDVDDPNAVIVDHDLTHARFNNEDQPRAEGFRLRALEWESSYSIPSIKIDLLRLVTSEKRYHRNQAARLLALEDGHPIYLSGDWHHQLQGIHFVTQITETITGTGWDLSLSLAPAHFVVGSVSPTVPARVWDSATYPWREESRTWNAA